MSAVPRFDLQSHSTVSDGTLPPAGVVAAAAAAGVELLALTDHDAIDGVQEAREAGAAQGVHVVAGTELSALDGDHEDLHVCGYAFDPADPGLHAALEAFRADRSERAWRMADALEEAGLALDRAPLRARADAGGAVGRPHLAGAVLAHPANAARLREEGLTTPSDVLVAYLLPGTPGYRRRTTPTVAEAIDAIHAAGGLAVWAHPFWDLDEHDAALATLDRFAALGLDGVEAFYTSHTAEEVGVLVGRAEELGLLTTGSSDFHGPDHERFSTFLDFDCHGHAPRLGPIAG